MIDTLIKGGRVVTETAVLDLDIAVTGGRIVGLLARGGDDPSAAEVIDASGLTVMPGGVDLHTHFTGSHDQPRAEARAGTAGAALGGITTVLEMPHSDPPATTLEGFHWKRELMSDAACVDFGLWAGLDGTNAGLLPALDEAGAIGFKAFLCSGDPAGRATEPSGLPRLDDHHLIAAMRSLREFDGLVAVHAENHDMLIGAGRALRAAGRNDMRAHAEAQPELAEIEAVARLALFAGETGARTHVVHVSSARAAARVLDARRSGARITLETCSHYLLLDEDDLARIGPDARCGPPLRPRATVEALWDAVARGDVDALASDHCPYPPERKAAGQASVWAAGMGLTGIETSAPMFLTEAVGRRGLPLVAAARLLATGPATIAGLYPRKGAVAVGADADLALHDLSRPWTVRGADFRGLGRWSAFEGMTATSRVVRTLVRGRTVQEDGAIRAEPGYGTMLRRPH